MKDSSSQAVGGQERARPMVHCPRLGLGAVNRAPASFRRCLFRCLSCDGVVLRQNVGRLAGRERHGWRRTRVTEISLVASVRLGFGKPKAPSGSLTPAAVSRSVRACLLPFFLRWGEMRVSLAPVVCVMLFPWVLSTGSRALSLVPAVHAHSRWDCSGQVSGASGFGKPEGLSKFPLAGTDLVGKTTG